MTVRLGAMGTPMPSISLRKRSRFSVMSMASVSTPIMRTPCCSQMPSFSHSMARFSAVWPPMVGSTASIWCCSRMASMLSGFSGRRYTLSAVTGSVMMVAGLLLISVTSMPSSRRERLAWLPE